MRWSVAFFLVGVAAAAEVPLHHKVSVHGKETQALFDQGLFEVYAFDFPAAETAFRRATNADPRCAMCWWGLALAQGPNYNETETTAPHKQATFEAAQKAVTLARGGPAVERALTDALARRFSLDESATKDTLANRYRNAMRTVHQRFPKDNDIATLYVESIIDLHPWQLWSKSGQAAPGTEEAVSILQEVLKREPRHVGANHLLIHAVEASPHPELALNSATLLKTLAPGASHLVHMPGHIEMRMGDYAAAVQSNVVAVSVDRAQQAHGMYAAHNLQFLAVAATLAGRSADALQAARELDALVRPMLSSMPGADSYLTTRIFTLAAFHKWDDILRMTPEKVDAPLTEAVLHFARGLAFAAAEKVEEATDERDGARRSLKAVSPEVTFGLNSVDAVFAVAFPLLDAAIAVAQHDAPAAKAAYRKAEAAEDSLNYDEPPSWFIPVRENFGGFLLRRNELPQAEVVFRRNLIAYPKSGRSLFGLAEALTRQGKEEDAKAIEAEFKEAWKSADETLSLEKL